MAVAVPSILLITSKNPKADEIKTILLRIFGNLKELFQNLKDLFAVLREIVVAISEQQESSKSANDADSAPGSDNSTEASSTINGTDKPSDVVTNNSQQPDACGIGTESPVSTPPQPVESHPNESPSTQTIETEVVIDEDKI